MSLFQCEVCGTRENTALAAQGFSGGMARCFDWSYAPEREGKKLCSECGPTHYRDGKPTEFGVWHGKFPKLILPLGMFVTGKHGNLSHKETGDQDISKYEVAGNE